MSLRITCTADTEVSCLPDLTDQLNRMVILIRKRKIRVCRNIPAKCKDVFDSALFQLMDYSMYLFSCGRDAGQMCDCRHPIRVDRICNLYGIITRSAGCSICTADICRFQLCDFCCNCLVILQLCSLFWREISHEIVTSFFFKISDTFIFFLYDN